MELKRERYFWQELNTFCRDYLSTQGRRPDREALARALEEHGEEWFTAQGKSIPTLEDAMRQAKGVRLLNEQRVYMAHYRREKKHKGGTSSQQHGGNSGNNSVDTTDASENADQDHHCTSRTLNPFNSAELQGSEITLNQLVRKGRRQSESSADASLGRQGSMDRPSKKPRCEVQADSRRTSMEEQQACPNSALDVLMAACTAASTGTAPAADLGLDAAARGQVPINQEAALKVDSREDGSKPAAANPCLDLPSPTAQLPAALTLNTEELQSLLNQQLQAFTNTTHGMLAAAGLVPNRTARGGSSGGALPHLNIAAMDAAQLHALSQMARARRGSSSGGSTATQHAELELAAFGCSAHMPLPIPDLVAGLTHLHQPQAFFDLQPSTARSGIPSSAPDVLTTEEHQPRAMHHQPPPNLAAKLMPTITSSAGAAPSPAATTSGLSPTTTCSGDIACRPIASAPRRSMSDCEAMVAAAAAKGSLPGRPGMVMHPHPYPHPEHLLHRAPPPHVSAGGMPRVIQSVVQDMTMSLPPGTLVSVREDPTDPLVQHITVKLPRPHRPATHYPMEPHMVQHPAHMAGSVMHHAVPVHHTHMGLGMPSGPGLVPGAMYSHPHHPHHSFTHTGYYHPIMNVPVPSPLPPARVVVAGEPGSAPPVRPVPRRATMEQLPMAAVAAAAAAANAMQAQLGAALALQGTPLPKTSPNRETATPAPQLPSPTTPPAAAAVCSPIRSAVTTTPAAAQGEQHPGSAHITR